VRVLLGVVVSPRHGSVLSRPICRKRRRSRGVSCSNRHAAMIFANRTWFRSRTDLIYATTTAARVKTHNSVCEKSSIATARSDHYSFGLLT
jgi:hypothetical protein